MSLTMTMLGSPPVETAAADGNAGPPQTGVANVAGVAAPAARAQNERAVATAAKFEPEIYCLKHGAQHAANGFAPCTDLGCSGCARR